MVVSTTKQELQRFLVMVTYIERFVKNVSDKTRLKTRNAFVWGPLENEEFQKLNSDLKGPPCILTRIKS